jgi:hypothetical protein
MSREISQDFSNLVEFIKKYNLQTLSGNNDFLTILSQQHKKFFSYLTCIAELIPLARENTLSPTISDNQIDFITESCSDIGSATFVMTHGAYKASKMMLRSSIETFQKGFNLDLIPDLDQEKSVFNIFDRVKALPFFANEPQKSLFNIIHHDYKLLCQDTHTAADINMQHITALKYFPTFSIVDATQLSDTLMRLVSSYNTLICLKYNEHFQKMHHRNKENIIENIPKPFRPLLHGID